METLAPACTGLHTTLSIGTRRRTAFIDLTDEIAAFVHRSGLRSGFVNVQTRHTTTGVVINEHEPLLLTDFEAFLSRIAPAWAAYRHDDEASRVVNLTPDERPNGYAHCRALLLPSSVCLNVTDGILQLGRWQRVFLVELDGPRARELSLVALGEVEAGR